MTRRFLTVLFLLLMALPVHAQQLNPGGGGGGGPFGGPITIMSINNSYLYADQFPGATIDVKLSNAEAACPTTGCTIDASNITGPQTWASGNTVTLSKPTKLLLNGQISYTGTPLPNGLIHLTDTSGSGDDISCAHGTGAMFVNPPLPSAPGGPVALNPPTLLTLWQCYILTNPTAPLGTVNISSIATTSAGPPPIYTATATGAVPFTAGQGVRISGVTPDTYNTFAIVRSVSGNTFTYVATPGSSGTTSGGTATTYMPVIDITYSTSNVNIHEMNFVANANTGSVIHESGGNRLGLPIANNHFNRNQMINTDGIGASGYGVEISSMGGMGEDTNFKEVAYNSMAGLAGCFYIDQANIVVANLVGNSCLFWTNAPAVKLDCYQCAATQNTDFRTNVVAYGYGPADHSAFEIDSGYNINIENNDFELPNILQHANVDVIDLWQGMVLIDNNAFLSTAGTNGGRYDISTGSTSSYNYLDIRGNHNAGGETYFFNNPVNPGGGQGYLYYGGNEDAGSVGHVTAGSMVAPELGQFTGSGSGVNYTTTSTAFVPVDGSRMMYDFWMPTGYIGTVQGWADTYNSTAGQGACLGIKDAVSGTLLNQKLQAASNTAPSEVSVQYILTGANQHYQIQLVYASCTGLGTTTITNNSTSNRPVMSVQLVPTTGGTN